MSESKSIPAELEALCLGIVRGALPKMVAEAEPIAAGLYQDAPERIKKHFTVRELAILRAACQAGALYEEFRGTPKDDALFSSTLAAAIVWALKIREEPEQWGAYAPILEQIFELNAVILRLAIVNGCIAVAVQMLIEKGPDWIDSQRLACIPLKPVD